MSGLPVTPSITLEAARVDTPIGPFFLAVREGTLVAASFDGREDGMARALERRFGPVSLEKHPDPGGIVARLRDRKSTRLNSSHANISYAVFCLNKRTCFV